MLAEAGCDGVILGHSERRQFFGETDEGVNKKLKAVLEAQLHPIVCVGETLAEREADRTWDVVSRQVRGALSVFRLRQSVAAPSPTSRCGPSAPARPPPPGRRRRSTRQIRGSLARDRGACHGGRRCASSTAARSSPTTPPSSSSQPDIDGALVGGASLKADDFARIVAGAR